MTRGVSGVAARLASWSARRPWIVIAGAVLVVGASIVSLGRTRISPSFQAMLGDGFPSAAALGRIARDYRALDELFVIATADGAGGKAAGSLLEVYAERLERAIAADPVAAGMTARIRYREDPAERAFFREVALPAGPIYLKGPARDTFFERLTEDGMQEQMARNETLAGVPGPAGGAIGKAILRDPLRLAELVDAAPGLAPGRGWAGADGGSPALDLSRDGRSLLIRIAGVKPIDDFEFAGAFTDRISTRAREAADGPGSGVDVEVAGGYAIAATTSRAIRSDSIVSALIAIGLLLVLFLVFYRRAGAPLAIGTAAAAGIITGFGVHALGAPTISPLTAVIAGMLAGLGVDYGIHFLSHFDAERTRSAGVADAAGAAAGTVGPPLLASCLTTVVGFVSLLSSRTAMIRDFAVLGALALLGALAGALFLMPAFLALSDRRRRARPQAAVGRLAEYAAGRPGTPLALGAALFVLALAGATWRGWIPRLESDLSALHPRPNRALELTDQIAERFTSEGESLAAELRAATPEALVALAHDVARALEAPGPRRAGVVGVLGINTLLPDPRNAPAVIDRLAALSPDDIVDRFDRALADSVLEPGAFAGYRDFLRSMVSARRAPGIPDLMTYPSIASRLFSQSETGAPTSTVVAVVLDRPLRDRASRAAAVDGVRSALSPLGGVTLTGMSVVAHDLELATRRDLPRSIAISLAMIAAYLLLLFRGLTDALLALTPVLLGCLFTAAFIVGTGQRLSAINGIALPLLVGIGVDAGVFMVAAARGARRDGVPLATRLAPTLHAVLAAATTTIAGFAALCFTRTPAIRSLGLVTSIGVAAGLAAATLVVMPLLLIRARREGRR